MNILYALVSFAVVMVIMTTLVVAVLEVVNSLRRSRERYLRYMIGSVFDEYLWPQYGELLDPIEIVVTNPIKPLRGDDEAGIPAAVPIPKFWMVKFFRLLDVPHNYRAFIRSRNDRTRSRVSGQPSNWPKVESAVNSLGTSSWRNRPNIVWVFLGLVAWIIVLLFGLAQLPFMLLLSVVLLIVLQIDRSREREREALPLLEELDDDKVDRLQQANALMMRLTKAHNESAPSEDGIEALRLNVIEFFASDSETADRYGRIYYRRRFVDEVVRLSRSIAAGGGGMQGRSQGSIGVLQFAEYLGSTHFGAAIRDVALARNQNEAGETPEEAIKNQVQEMARRYDALGQQATENYRHMTRRASVVLAFVVALVANFDAFHVFKAFTQDTELAQSVEQAYAGRLEEMSRQESAYVGRITALSLPNAAAENGTPLDTSETSAAIKATQAELEDLRTQMDKTVAELSDLGVPIGAQRFPFCGFADEERTQTDETEHSYAHPDPRCQTAHRVLNAGTNLFFSARGKDDCRPATFFAERKDVLPLSFSGLLTCHGYSIASEAGDDEVGIFQRWGTNLSANWHAAVDWMAIRWSHGMAEWLAGILVAGALIGLGGPFWFDLYSRLSSVVRITRSFGMKPNAKPVASEKDNASPETQHNPENVQDAFQLSLKAVTKVQDYKTEMRSFALRATMTETQREDDTIAKPRHHHDANGTPID